MKLFNLDESSFKRKQDSEDYLYMISGDRIGCCYFFEYSDCLKDGEHSKCRLYKLIYKMIGYKIYESSECGQ